MARWQKVRVEIPPGFSKEDRISIGRDIITFIQERAIEKNTGFNPDTGRNKKFPKYSKEYAEKKGVSVDDVNLIDTGEMFNEMDVLNETSRTVTVGFKEGSPALGKAEGNHKGASGKARPFLGLTQADLNRIIAKFDS